LATIGADSIKGKGYCNNAKNIINMSSHHIVREKQEPALLVLGLDNFDDELLGQLLEWSPTVIATQHIAEKLNSYGIKIDWIITDGGEEIQSDVKILPVNSNALQSAMTFLTDSGYPSVNVITDALNLDDYQPFVNKINLVIFYNDQKIYPVASGFSKWKPVGETINILSAVNEIQHTGLAALSAHQFKTITDGFFTLHFNNPHIFLAENL
jgi:thiamine pyrophosphokinase